MAGAWTAPTPNPGPRCVRRPQDRPAPSLRALMHRKSPALNPPPQSPWPRLSAVAGGHGCRPVPGPAPQPPPSMGGTDTPPSPDGDREGRYSSPERRNATPGSGLAPDTPYALRTPARAEASTGASPAVGRGAANSGSPAVGQQQGEFTGNLRRMTNNLMEIFDQMSNRGAGGLCVEESGEGWGWGGGAWFPPSGAVEPVARAAPAFFVHHRGDPARWRRKRLQLAGHTAPGSPPRS